MKCIIVEDELPAVKVIQNHISHFSDLELIGTYNNAMDAFMELQKNQSIDIVFLDIQLPQMSGIQLLHSLSKFPSIIITTAYREFVTDYLLKPISLERFTKAIAKIYKQQFKPLKIPDYSTENKPALFQTL